MCYLQCSCKVLYIGAPSDVSRQDRVRSICLTFSRAQIRRSHRGQDLSVHKGLLAGQKIGVFFLS